MLKGEVPILAQKVKFTAGMVGGKTKVGRDLLTQVRERVMTEATEFCKTCVSLTLKNSLRNYKNLRIVTMCSSLLVPIRSL